LIISCSKLFLAHSAGNTVVLKPSEETPLSVLKLGELFSERGFPNGVLNTIPGCGDTVGKVLSRHNRIRKISFS